MPLVTLLLRGGARVAHKSQRWSQALSGVAALLH